MASDWASTYAESRVLESRARSHGFVSARSSAARSDAKDCLVPLRQQGKKSRGTQADCYPRGMAGCSRRYRTEKVALAVPHAQSPLGHLTWPWRPTCLGSDSEKRAIPQRNAGNPRPSLNYSTSSPSTGIHDHPTPSSPASPAPFAGSANLPSSTASPTP